MIISRAPLRVSFFGGGTDFPDFFLKEGGCVLATAINKYSYVTTSTFESKLFEYAVRVSYSKGELAKNIDDLKHPVFRECLRYCGLSKDIELHTVADLPSFTGLGSSSSFTVALLQALHAFRGDIISPLDLAYEAIHIERRILGECVGVQDQTTAAIGGFNLLEFIAEDDIRVYPLEIRADRINELEANIFLLFTGIKRSAQVIERSKIDKIQTNIDSLREMKRMAYKGAELIRNGGSLESFGLLLHQAWIKKRLLANTVTNEEINRLYKTGIDAGAWGGKLLGAGGGGFILFVAPPEVHGVMRANLSGYLDIKCKINSPGASVIFDG